MRRALLLALLLIVVAVGLFLGGRNAQPVILDYYFGTIELSLAIALILSMLTGILLGASVVYFGTVLRLQVRNRRMRRELARQADPDAARLTAD